MEKAASDSSQWPVRQSLKLQVLTLSGSIYRKTDGIRTKQKSELLETWRFPAIEAAQTQSGCHVVVMNASLLWMVRLKFTDLKFPPILRG